MNTNDLESLIRTILTEQLTPVTAPASSAILPAWMKPLMLLTAHFALSAKPDENPQRHYPRYP
uniref:Uncharacterized protein n=1 Tax=Yersinia enterocolitica W22703 TaxID=913028 RepID=F4MX00_YEREN|nr:unknown protein [Yersinia enterocolitica W22703]